MGYFVYDKALLSCHGIGIVSPLAAKNKRVSIEGNNYVMTDKDDFAIKGCHLYYPCSVAIWNAPRSRIKISGNPVILDDSDGRSHHKEYLPPQGNLRIMTQTRVKGALKDAS
jgi:hypothetical protein